MEFTLLFMAAGVGSRLGAGRPKQFLPLGDETLLTHSLALAASFPEVTEVVVVGHPDHLEETKALVGSLHLTQETAVVAGGDPRQESVYLGLQACHREGILLHEAARPFVRREDFRAILDDPAPNATYASPVPFTILEGKDEIETVLDRSRLWNVQLPQKFQREPLTEAHRIARERGLLFTDDSSVLYTCMGLPVRILPGRPENLKITTATDFRLAELLWPDWIRGDGR